MKIEDAENKLNNGIIQQIPNLDHLLGSVNQNKVGQNEHCLSADREIRAVCEASEEACNRKGQVEWELEDRQNQINKPSNLF